MNHEVVERRGCGPLGGIEGAGGFAACLVVGQLSHEGEGGGEKDGEGEDGFLHFRAFKDFKVIKIFNWLAVFVEESADDFAGVDVGGCP